MKLKNSKVRYWRSVFRRIVAKYDEKKSNYAYQSAIDYSVAIENAGACATYHGVKPNDADFIADVELAAKRALNPLEHFFFKQIYVEKNEAYKNILLAEWGEEKYTDFKHRVQEKVGNMLVYRKVHPYESYMQSNRYKR